MEAGACMRKHLESVVPIGEGRPRPVSHLEALIWAAENPGPQPKRNITRTRLLAATAKAMSTNAYFGLRVADIALAAGMSPAAFHVYFSDRKEAAREVLSGLLWRLYLVDPHDGRGGVRAFTLMIRRLLEALQADAPLVRALNHAVLVDEVVAELSDSAARLWRARLNATLYGSEEGALRLGASPAPDALDLMVAGMIQRAGTPLLTPDALSRLATEIGRAWLVVQGSPTAPGLAVSRRYGQVRPVHA